MRRAALVSLALAALGVAGCSDESGTFDDPHVPFTFALPAKFTKESVDRLNSRGDVVAVVALDKVNAIGVRRVPATFLRTETKLRVLGDAVTSDVRPVSGAPGWALECQYTAARRATMLDACAEVARKLHHR